MDILRVELIESDDESGLFKTDINGTSAEICAGLVCILQGLMDRNQYDILTKAFTFIMDENNIPKEVERGEA